MILAGKASAELALFLVAEGRGSGGAIALVEGGRRSTLVFSLRVEVRDTAVDFGGGGVSVEGLEQAERQRRPASTMVAESG